MKTILKLERISFHLRKINQTILKNITLEIYQSEIFGLTGESGSGKSTLAKIIAGLEKQTSGKKYFYEKEFSEMESEHRIQILFQNYSASHDPLKKIDSTFNEILKIKKFNSEDLFRHKKEILDLVGLSDSVLSLYPNQLSGGQLQRLALAKLLLINPPFLILGEPFASQDFVSVVNLIKIFQQINQKLKTTFFCISHEIPFLIKFCNRIGIMKDGEIKDILTVERQGNLIEIKNRKTDYTNFLFQSFGMHIKSS